MTLDYKTYRDKVFGCYIGKSVGGTFGAPYEGMKQRINVPFDRAVIDGMLVNDDLDLQLLFFSAVKVYGEYVNPEILARYFLEKYDFSAGEYGYFKKNYERGILPPFSGPFNNVFYNEGMGAVIRGELWGCLFPLNPQKAMEYAQMDGMLDHSREGVVSIMFLSALVSLSFGSSPVNRVVEEAISIIPQGRFRSMAEHVYSMCLSDMSEEDIYEAVLCDYSHPDCTNVFQNMAFVIIGLMRKFKSFKDMCQTVNGYGYDTDCTVGICAAVYGLFNGGEALLKEFGREDIPLVTLARCHDYGGSIKAFSYDIALYGGYFASKLSDPIEGWEDFGFTPVCEPYLYPVKYDPVLGRGEEQNVELAVKNIGNLKIGDVTVTPPEGYSCKIDGVSEYGDEAFIFLTCRAGENIGKDVALFKVNIKDKEYSFGFAAPIRYRVSKPYLSLPMTIDLNEHPKYYSAFDGLPGNRDENIRRYHLSFRPDYDTPFVDACGDWNAVREVELFTDVFKMSDFTSSRCPCTVYVSREIVSDTDRDVRMVVGCEDGMQIWLNGQKVVDNDKVGMYYPEMKYVHITIRKGVNKLVYRLTRSTSTDAAYSVIFAECGNLLDFPKFALGFTNK